MKHLKIYSQNEQFLAKNKPMEKKIQLSVPYKVLQAYRVKGMKTNTIMPKKQLMRLILILESGVNYTFGENECIFDHKGEKYKAFESLNHYISGLSIEDDKLYTFSIKEITL